MSERRDDMGYVLEYLEAILEELKKMNTARVTPLVLHQSRKPEPTFYGYDPDDE